MRVRVVDDRPPELTGVVRLGRVHQGAPGLAHGGLVTTVLDEVMSLALWRTLDRPYVTRLLDTDFRAPMRVGCDIALRASCTGVHGRKAYAQAEAWFGETLLAKATAMFIELPDTPNLP